MSFTATAIPDTPSVSLGSLKVNVMGTHATGNGHENQTKLRRRIHILECPSNPYEANGESFQSNRPVSDNAAHVEEREVPPHKDEETWSITSDDLVAGGASDNNSNASGESYVNGSPIRESKHHPRNSSDSSYASVAEPSPYSQTRAWYDFDLAVVVALVSPVGNWLTGGDHVKNFLLIALLIFYLHQIIEIPWSLYNASRARRSPPHAQFPPPDALDHHRRLASSELRKLEILFLTLTVLSPFMGAAILRYFTEYVSGVNVISWFSTALFVLATGVRPWRHIVERLTERTRDLHDVIHYPPRLPHDNLQTKMDEMMERVTQLERSLANVRLKMGKSTEELYEYVDDAVDAVEKSVRRHDRKCEKHDARLKAAEDNIDGLRKTALRIHTNFSTRHSPSLIPSWFHLGFAPDIPSPTRLSSPASKHLLRTSSSSLNPSPIRLESIPEENTPASLPMYHWIPGMSLMLRYADLAALPFRMAMQYLPSIP